MTSKMHVSDLQSMVDGAIAKKSQWTDTEKTNLLKLLGEFRSAFQNNLAEELAHDRAQWSTEHAKIAACNAFSNTRFNFGGDIHSLEAEVDQWYNKHKACQKASKSWDVMKSSMTSGACDASTAAFLLVPAPLQTLQANILSHEQTRAAYLSTSPATTLQDLPGTCDVDQSRYEHKVCELRHSKVFACAAEELCKQVVDLQAVKTQLDSRGQARRKQKKSVLTLSCKLHDALQVHHNTTTDASEQPVHDCETDPKYQLNATELLVSTTMPADTPCATDIGNIYPSTSDATLCQSFRASAYDAWSGDFNKPTNCVTTCQAAPVAPAPTIPGGCQDTAPDDGDCAFFDRHHDSCNFTGYKTDVFDPESACCSCGGGATPNPKFPTATHSVDSASGLVAAITTFGQTPCSDTAIEVTQDITLTANLAEVSSSTCKLTIFSKNFNTISGDGKYQFLRIGSPFELINLKLNQFNCNLQGSSGVVQLKYTSQNAHAKFTSVSFTNNGMTAGYCTAVFRVSAAKWTIDFIDSHFEGSSGSGAYWVKDVSFGSKPDLVTSSCTGITDTNTYKADWKLQEYGNCWIENAFPHRYGTTDYTPPNWADRQPFCTNFQNCPETQVA